MNKAIEMAKESIIKNHFRVIGVNRIGNGYVLYYFNDREPNSIGITGVTLSEAIKYIW